MNDHGKKEAAALIDQKFEQITMRLESLHRAREAQERTIRVLGEKIRLLTNLLTQNHGRT